MQNQAGIRFQTHVTTDLRDETCMDRPGARCARRTANRSPNPVCHGDDTWYFAANRACELASPIRRRAPGGALRRRVACQDQRRLMVNLPTDTPRFTPSPVPASASDVVPLVSTCAVPLLTTPASAPAWA